MVLKNITLGCGVRASLMLFFFILSILQGTQEWLKSTKIFILDGFLSSVHIGKWLKMFPGKSHDTVPLEQY